MLNETQIRFFTGSNPAIVTTLRRDGSAHSTLTWVDWDGEFVLINTVVGGIKEKHLRKDDRITVCVVDRDNPNWYVGVEGRAGLTTDGARDQVNRLSHRYLARASPFQDGAERILARFRPERGWGIYDETSEAELKAGRDWERNTGVG